MAWGPLTKLMFRVVGVASGTPMHLEEPTAAAPADAPRPDETMSPPSVARATAVSGAAYGDAPFQPKPTATAAQRGLHLQMLAAVTNAPGWDLSGNFLLQQQALQNAARSRGLAPLPAGDLDDTYEGATVTAEGVFAERALTHAAAIQPAHKTSDDLVLLVNGMKADVQRHTRSLQEFADASGCATIGVHNATGGLACDVMEALGAVVGMRQRAVDVLAHQMMDIVEQKLPVLIVGHSQGGQIVAQAAKLVQRELRSSGLPEDEVMRRMAHLRIETHGATGFSYPDGPTYAHYCNLQDVVAKADADPRRASRLGRDAVVVHFDDPGDGSMLGPHLLITYLRHRIPFDLARSRLRAGA